jgi:hypothetical protein
VATTSSPYGLQPINLLGGQSFVGSTRLYAIDTASTVTAGCIQYGDPVVISAGLLQRASTNATAAQQINSGVFVGTFIGCTYRDPLLGTVFRQNAPAAFTGLSNVQGYVVDDPDAVFQIQANGTVAQASLGKNADLIQLVGGSTEPNRMSGLALRIASIGTTATLPVRIVGFVDGPTSAVGDAFTDVLVRINTHLHRTALGV